MLATSFDVGFSSELSEFLLNFFRSGLIDSLRCEKTFNSPFALVFESHSLECVPPFGEIVCVLSYAFPLQIWKDSIISYFVLFCSFSTQIFLLFDCQGTCGSAPARGRFAQTVASLPMGKDP